MEASPSTTATPSYSKSLLRRSMDRLAEKNYSSSQILAGEALDSDPILAAAAGRILTVSGVLLSGQRRDFYAVLSLSRAEADDSHLVWTRFERLAETLASPELNGVAFVQDAYDLAYEAWSVLSDPEKKRSYDAEIKAASFWTACPYCCCLFQYEKAYEECCLRCQKCSRAFHGVAIPDPSPEIIVPGKDQYFLFPLGNKQKLEPDSNGGGEGSEGPIRRKRMGKEPARRMKNVKSIAKKKKAISISDTEESQNEKANNDDGDLVCYEVNGDVVSGLEDIS